MAFLAVSLLSSCSETDEENTEFADWQNRNETYFSAKYAEIRQRKKPGHMLSTSYAAIPRIPQRQSPQTSLPWKCSTTISTALKQDAQS